MQMLWLLVNALVIAAAAAGGLLGYVVPMLFDRDVGGVIAATIFGALGLALGAGVGVVIIGRNFD